MLLNIMEEMLTWKGDDSSGKWRFGDIQPDDRAENPESYTTAGF